MLHRRKFISQAALVTGSLFVHPYFGKAAALFSKAPSLTILHTNDVHSHVDPFPIDGSAYQGLGGVVARAQLINKIRSEEENVLLLDAGDVFQGTPYFNLFKGEPELKAMTAMGYDAGTIGNHEFDAGIENLSRQIGHHAAFPLIVCNYDFTGTPMEHQYIPYKIFKKGALKIGVLGVGIELKGLVPDNQYGATKYLDPIRRANEVADELKRKGCDLIVCLSHLGFEYDTSKVSDKVLAKETQNIDVIIGGHSHTFLEKPFVQKNKIGADVVINQVGWGGVQLGRLDFIFESKRGKNFLNGRSISVTKISDE